MRRTTAATLTAVLALFVLLPYLSLLSHAESNLAACCRRNGHHHCATMMEMARSFVAQGTAFRTVGCRCPLQKAMTPAFRLAVYPLLSATADAAVVSHPAIYMQAMVSGLVSKSRSHQKRGPPFLLSC